MVKHLRRFLLYPLAATLPALALAAGQVTATQASTARPAPPPSTTAIAEQLISHLNAGPPRAGRDFAGIPRSQIGPPLMVGTAWSGYGYTGSTPSTVMASWEQPSVTCSPTGVQFAMFWVGLDGLQNDTTEHAGTMTVCVNGRQASFTWWEMAPSTGIKYVGNAVQQGDEIQAEVNAVRTPLTTQFFLSVTDASSQSQSFITAQDCSGCAQASAEAITSVPQNANGSSEPLAHFREWDPGVTVLGGAFSSTKVVMVDGNANLQAEPGPLFGQYPLQSTGFTDNWYRST